MNVTAGWAYLTRSAGVNNSNSLIPSESVTLSLLPKADLLRVQFPSLAKWVKAGERFITV